LALRPDTRLALCVMPAWFIWLWIAYSFSRYKGAHWVKTTRSITGDPRQ
jgi:D-serine/D-alanine/glycine transporter